MDHGDSEGKPIARNIGGGTDWQLVQVSAMMEHGDGRSVVFGSRSQKAESALCYSYSVPGGASQSALECPGGRPTEA